MTYNITDRTIDITASTTVMPEKNYGGWFAANQGTNSALVNGYELQPGEALDRRFDIPVGCKYDSPIKIIINPGAVVRLTRILATPVKERR